MHPLQARGRRIFYLAHRNAVLSSFVAHRQLTLFGIIVPHVFRYGQCDRVGATTRATGGRGKRSSGASTMEVHGGVGSATYSTRQTPPLVPIHHSSARICGQTFQETREPSIQRTSPQQSHNHFAESATSARPSPWTGKFTW